MTVPIHCSVEILDQIACITFHSLSEAQGEFSLIWTEYRLSLLGLWSNQRSLCVLGEKIYERGDGEDGGTKRKEIFAGIVDESLKLIDITFKLGGECVTEFCVFC
jgi:hypothetical protein